MNLSKSCSVVRLSNVECLSIDNEFASAKISLFGGHLLSFTPKHDLRERIWLSPQAVLDGSKAIRGGVPICWPWFGDHSDPMFKSHGYVRNQLWKVISCDDVSEGTQIALQPSSSGGDGLFEEAVLGKNELAKHPNRIEQVELTLFITIGRELRLNLQTKNIGKLPFIYTGALHSYFLIEDINTCEIKGLKGKYFDKTKGYESFDTPAVYSFNNETDRVHLQQPKLLSIIDKKMATTISSTGHDSIVVWNPWHEKSIAMSDMPDDGYQTMLCVETAVTQGQSLKPDEVHSLEQTIA